MRFGDGFSRYAGVKILFWLAVLLPAACAYAPEQPIEYSHEVHAGKYQIECLHCHFGAETSRHAGVPPAQVCMNCHSQVKRDSPEVQKISTAVTSGTPIAWIRVHRFPDHAFFDHSRHVSAGGIKCQTCHGPVETMSRVYQVENMSMGFCLDCHRKADPLTAGIKPSTDCSGCH
ncbi:MAG: cytochrome c3 family protein [Acidobacteria bacterium]|nr:cytochrome c3 family protein [Acidobacteriota bacterium]